MRQYIAIADPNESFTTPKLRREIWKQRIDKMVKSVKDITTSQWAAPILLALLLGYNVYDGKQKDAQLVRFQEESQKQHDLLIELRTIKDMEEKQKVQEKIDKKLDEDKAQIWRETMNKGMSRLELIVKGEYPNSKEN